VRESDKRPSPYQHLAPVYDHRRSQVTDAGLPAKDQSLVPPAGSASAGNDVECADMLVIPLKQQRYSAKVALFQLEVPMPIAPVPDLKKENREA
jgi:hypothetical protein